MTLVNRLEGARRGRTRPKHLAALDSEIKENFSFLVENSAHLNYENLCRLGNPVVSMHAKNVDTVTPVNLDLSI